MDARLYTTADETICTISANFEKVAPKRQYRWVCAQNRENFLCLTLLSERDIVLGIFGRQQVGCGALIICLVVRALRRKWYRLYNELLSVDTRGYLQTPERINET